MGDPRVPDVQRLTGVVVDDDGDLRVNVNGSIMNLTWPAGYIPTLGDVVGVNRDNGRGVITGPIIRGSVRALTGIAGAASGGLVPVTTDAGVVDARYTGSAPTPGSSVRLDWQATTPWIIPGAVVALGVPASAGATPAAPRPVVASGKLTAAAIDSATYSSAGVWDSHYGTNVTQGSYGGRTYTGAWFYGSQPKRLAGRTVTYVWLYLGPRVRQGDYNNPLTLNLYRHTSLTRPSGDVTRTGAVSSHVLPVNSRGGWVPLPTSMGQSLVDYGGGISAAGGSYGGVRGISHTRASGQLIIGWER
jgi:hypothetical protein